MLIVLLALTGSCTEHATELSPLRDARVLLRPSYVVNGASQTLPITRIRLTATEVGTNAVLETVTETVDPTADSWSLDFGIPVRSATRVVVSIELIHVTATGAESVEWSGVTGELSLRPGSAQSEGLAIFPGPLDNLQITALAIADVPPNMTEGESAQLRAAITAPPGINARVLWSSSDEDVLVVDADGRIEALSPGLARITAQAGVRSAQADIVVQARGVSIMITPTTVTLDHLGAEAGFSAVVLDPRGNPLPNAPISWGVDNVSVLMDLGGGNFRAVGVGSTTVRASLGSSPVISAAASVTVTQRAATVTVSPSTNVLDAIGATVQLNATAVDAGGATLPANAISWATSDADVATVDQTGLVTAVANGTVSILAEAGGVSGNAEVRVELRAAQLNVLSGSGQTATAGNELSERIVVRALDRLGNPLNDVEVTFIPAADGSVSPASSITDADGRASTRWTLASEPGAQELRAVAENLTAIISATALGRTATALAVHAGNDQTATVNTAVAVAPAVRITDAAGQPMAGITVTFSLVSGGGSIAGATPVTDANGVATLGSWTLGTAAGLNQISASADGLAPVTFNATATADIAASIIIVSGNAQTARSGTLLPAALVVRVQDQFANPLAGVTVSFATASGGSVNPVQAVTAANGEAATQWTLGPQAGAQELRASVVNLSDAVFTATAESATAAALVIHAGDGQTATVGQSVAIVPAVRITDSSGNPVAGVTVTFAVVAGGGSVTDATPITNADGVATLGSWTMGTTPIVNQISAAAAGVDPVTFNATAVAGAPASLVIVSGSGQSAQRGTALTDPLVVHVADNFGNALTGVNVAFTTAHGSAEPAAITTGADGNASTIWTLGTQPGAQELRASVDGLPEVVFTATAEGGTASFVAIHAGNTQSASPGTAVTVPPAVRVTDAFEQPVAGVSVTFEIVSGGGSITGTPALTDANGVAAVGSWTLGTAGTNELRATVTGLTPVSFTATAVSSTPAISLALADGHTNVGVSFHSPLRVILSAPAPAGGVTVNVVSSNTAKLLVESTGTVVITEGATEGTIQLEGVEAGTATLTASAAGHTSANLTVTVSLRLISLPVTLNVPYGQTASLPIQLAEPAPAGGVVVSLLSADETLVRVLTPTVTIPAGSSLGSATVEGARPGTATVTAAADGFIGASASVSTRANLDIVQTSLRLNASFGNEFTIRLRSAGNAIAAPAGGVQVAFNAVAPLCAGVPATATIPEGLTQINVPVTYGGDAALPCATRVHATAENILPDSLNVTVDPTPVISFSSANVGAGLQRQFAVSLNTTTHDGVIIRITSADDTRLLLAPNGSTVGAATLDITLPPGTSSAAFFAQAPGGTGSVVITGTADHVTTGTATINILQPAIDIAGLPTTTTTLNANDAFQIRIGLPNATNTFLTELQSVRAGSAPIEVTVQSDAPAVATLTNSAGTAASRTVAIAATQSSSPGALSIGGVELDPVGAGSAVIQAAAPGVITTSAAVRTITVNAAAISMTQSTVGAGLMRSQSVTLGASTHGGVTVRVTSSDPARLLVAATSGSVGSAFIDVPLLNGNAFLSYVTQAIEGATGSVTVTATAPGFTDGSAAIPIVAPALDLTGVPGTMTTTAPDDAFTARIGIPNATNAFLNELQALRTGGPGLQVTITTNAETVATLATNAGVASSVTLSIAPGATGTPAAVTSGGVAVRPLSAGSATIAATAPGVISTTAATRAVTVNNAGISMNSSPVGAGLQRSQGGNLAGSDHGGVTLRVRSSQPELLLVAPNTTTAGSEFIDIVVPNGSTSFSYVAQALDGVTGDVTVTATAPGFSDGSTTIAIVQPGLDIAGLTTNVNTLSADDPFTVRIGVPNSTGAFLNELQQRRFGGEALIATVTSSTTAGQIITQSTAGGSATTAINANASSSPSNLTGGGVGFRPFSGGTTVVSATIPGFRVLTSSQATVTVNAPSITLHSVTVGGGLQRSASGSLSSGAHGGITVRVSSSNSGVALVSPDATTAGQGAIDIFVPNNTTSFTYYVHGIEGAVATVALHATAPGFTDGSATATVVQPALDIAALDVTTSEIGALDPFTVRIGIPNSTGTFLNELQAVRAGGAALAVTVTTSNAGHARLATSSTSGESVDLTITAGSSSTPSTVATGGVQLEPVAAGNATISAQIAGFILTAGSREVTVAPATLSMTGGTVGAGLQRFASIQLNGGNHGGITVRLTSADPSKLLVSPNNTTAGTATTDIVIANGVTSITYMLHGVEHMTGNVVVEATATGLVSGSASIPVVQPAVEILSLATTTTAAAVDDPFILRVGIPNSLLTAMAEVQSVRAGSPGLTATISSSNAAVGLLVTAADTGSASVAIAIPANASQSPANVAAGGVAFDPLAAGSTAVTGAIPGFRALPNSTVNVTVN